jgi:hypothetical protein
VKTRLPVAVAVPTPAARLGVRATAFDWDSLPAPDEFADLDSQQTSRRTSGPREWAIGSLSLIAVVLASFVTHVVADPGHPGYALRAPATPPPPPGACVLIEGHIATVSDCALPHSGEVVASWPAGQRPGPAPDADVVISTSVNRQLPASSEDEVCAGWADAYTGWQEYSEALGNQTWVRSRPLVVDKLAFDPVAPHLDWSACVARTSVSLYTGTLRDIALLPEGQVAEPRTTALAASSVCARTRRDSIQFVPCTQPHNLELLGSIRLTDPTYTAPITAPDLTLETLRTSCVELAARRLGTADPTFGGSIQVLAESLWQQRGASGAVPPGWRTPDCLLRVYGRAMLSDSLVGIGSGTLPLG